LILSVHFLSFHHDSGISTSYKLASDLANLSNREYGLDSPMYSLSLAHSVPAVLAFLIGLVKVLDGGGWWEMIVTPAAGWALWQLARWGDAVAV
jgi:hypothetical protein